VGCVGGVGVGGLIGRIDINAELREVVFWRLSHSDHQTVRELGVEHLECND